MSWYISTNEPQQGWIIFYAQKQEWKTGGRLNLMKKFLEMLKVEEKTKTWMIFISEIVLGIVVVVGVGYNAIRADENLIPNWSHGAPQ